MQNWTFVIICSRRLHNCKTCYFTSWKERERLRNVKMHMRNENCTCKACKTFVFHCQICKFVTLFLPPSSWLLKLPIMREEDDEESLEEPVVTFESPFSISLWLLYMISYAIVFVLVNVRLRSRSAAVYYNDRLLVISFSLALFLVLNAYWKHLSESFTMVIQP